MAKRKLSLLVQAMNLFAQMDERDKQTLADYVRSQMVKPRVKMPPKLKKQPTLEEVIKPGSSAA